MLPKIAFDKRKCNIFHELVGPTKPLEYCGILSKSNAFAIESAKKYKY